MMSASYTSNYEQGVTRSDLDAFLLKPLDLKSLLNTIKEITELSSKTENQSMT
jgi:hypothetical protein